ncbi:uncharacterized protein LOC126836223 isoform X1 [Adelges cooleyi]|uniref:uncharacterized protein LOC126836223 isoform X1 n=1 Tax=Adelges cooleyi TaxID=133065 RepID=UPI00217FA701|nr:uncharacterized protein LOC126836223 isoform X1 [Adelges cooleyi]XP_050425398.1 uncharacterized protein LOC126836223 isoform X1 [Adelges cooleyi]
MTMNKKTTLLSAAIVTFALGTLFLGLTIKRPASDPYHWDILIFTQTWPMTLCYTWKEHNPSHECHFPPDKTRWTIHGIWPTKLGTLGPHFCNKTEEFDPKIIHSIQNELDEYWTDIELPQNNTANFTVSNKKSIWFHEWEKHGTCAMSLPALDSEFKYFSQGIEWAKGNYSMKDILEKADIKINSTLTVDDYWKKIKSVLKVNVFISCFYRSDTKEQLLDEIRICFNKNLELIDCDGIEKTRRSVLSTLPLTDCDSKKPILYLDHMTPHDVSAISNENASYLTNNEHSKVLPTVRSKRSPVNQNNEWITKTSRHSNRSNDNQSNPNITVNGDLSQSKSPQSRPNNKPNYDFNRSNSYQPHTNTQYNRNLNRSNSYPYILRKEWDYLIFSQAWPYTFCHTWTIDSSSHTCNLPANRNQWTIHGIWPTKVGTFGPSYCNNQTAFHIEKLGSIKSDLKNRWTEVKDSKSWVNKKEGELWRHEWKKHGTCAMSIPVLDSEFKYFKQGLDWNKQYPLNDILSQGSIKPNGTYPMIQFWQTLKNGLGKRPFIDCFTDKTTKITYIDEVRLCFDKSLSLIDCDRFKKQNDKPNTNCPKDQQIYYPGIQA